MANRREAWLVLWESPHTRVLYGVVRQTRDGARAWERPGSRTLPLSRIAELEAVAKACVLREDGWSECALCRGQWEDGEDPDHREDCPLAGLEVLS